MLACKRKMTAFPSAYQVHSTCLKDMLAYSYISSLRTEALLLYKCCNCPLKILVLCQSSIIHTYRQGRQRVSEHIQHQCKKNKPNTVLSEKGVKSFPELFTLLGSPSLLACTSNTLVHVLPLLKYFTSLLPTWKNKNNRGRNLKYHTGKKEISSEENYNTNAVVNICFERWGVEMVCL